MARRYSGEMKPPPPDAAERIRALAADGWSVKGIARQLGTADELLKVWMESDPALQDAFDAGREEEHQALRNALFRKATEGNDTTAAIFLLKARHGYREGAQEEPGSRVNIVFNLPGALPIEKFAGSNAKTIHGPTTKK